MTLPPDFCPLVASDAEISLWESMGRPTQEQMPHALTLRIEDDDLEDFREDYDAQ